MAVQAAIAEIGDRVGVGSGRPDHNWLSGPMSLTGPSRGTGPAAVYHTPALVSETVGRLVTAEGKVYIDGTTGEGGHSEAMLASAAAPRLVLGIDLDPRSLAIARTRLAGFGERYAALAGSYVGMAELAGEQGVFGVDGVLLDLGFSSRQIETEGYGLSFQWDEPLDMRYDPEAELTAGHIVNNYREAELIRLLREFGEEPNARPIARAIIRQRPIVGGLELARLVAGVVGRRTGSGVNPATRTFQALRIAVNDELNNLRLGLEAAVGLLNPGGRLAVISYHSLEDRAIKSFFTREAAGCVCPPQIPVCVCGHAPRLRIINRRVIKPSIGEVRANPRTRSAKLRVAERL